MIQSPTRLLTVRTMRETILYYEEKYMCEYCGIKPAFQNNISGHCVYDKEGSQRVLAPGGMHSDLVMGVDENGAVFMESDEGENNLWYPNFCPICGRNLKK